MAREKDPEWLSASELGSYKFCAKQLEHSILGTPVGREGQKRLRRGTQEHHLHGVAYDWQIRLRRIALFILGLAIAAGAVAFSLGVL